MDERNLALRESLRDHQPFKYDETRNSKGEVVSSVRNSIFFTESNDEERKKRGKTENETTGRCEILPEVFSVRAFDSIRNAAHVATAASTSTNPKIAIRFVPTSPIRGTIDVWNCRLLPSNAAVVVSTLGFPTVSRHFEYRATGMVVRDARLNDAIFRADLACGIGMKRREWNPETLGEMIRATSDTPPSTTSTSSSSSTSASNAQFARYPEFERYRATFLRSPKTHADSETLRELHVWIYASQFLNKYLTCGFSSSVFLDESVAFVRCENYERLVVRRWDAAFDVDYLLRRGAISQLAHDFHLKMRFAGSTKRPSTFTPEEIELGIAHRVFSPVAVHGKHHLAKAEEMFKCLETIRLSTQPRFGRFPNWEIFECEGKTFTTPSSRTEFVRRWKRSRRDGDDDSNGVNRWKDRIYHRASFDWWTAAPSEYVDFEMMPRNAPNSVELAAASTVATTTTTTASPTDDEPCVLFFFDAHLIAAHKLWQVLTTTMRHHDEIERVVLIGSDRHRRAANEILGYRFYSALDYVLESRRLPLFPHVDPRANLSRRSKLHDDDDDDESEVREEDFVEYVQNLDRSSVPRGKRRRVVCFPSFASTREFITAVRRIATESMRVVFINHKHDVHHSPPTLIHVFNETTFIPDAENTAEMNAAALREFESRLKRVETRRLITDRQKIARLRRSGVLDSDSDDDDETTMSPLDEDPERHYGLRRGKYVHRITWNSSELSTTTTPIEKFRGVERVTIEDLCNPERFVGSIPNVVVLCADAMTKDNHVRFAYEACDTMLILVGIPTERARAVLCRKVEKKEEKSTVKRMKRTEEEAGKTT